MKTVLGVLVFLGISVANAEVDHSFYYLSAPKSTCSSLQRFIAKHGWAIVFKSDDIYDRVVYHQGFCFGGDFQKGPAYYKTKDVKDCFVGYKCGPR